MVCAHCTAHRTALRATARSASTHIATRRPFARLAAAAPHGVPSLENESHHHVPFGVALRRGGPSARALPHPIEDLYNVARLAKVKPRRAARRAAGARGVAHDAQRPTAGGRGGVLAHEVEHHLVVDFVGDDRDTVPVLARRRVLPRQLEDLPRGPREKAGLVAEGINGRGGCPPGRWCARGGGCVVGVVREHESVAGVRLLLAEVAGVGEGVRLA